MVQVSDTPRTPKTERGRRTRDKLLQAAEIEFGQKGYYEAGISGITHRAGVALGTFYTYFDSKEEIFRALVRYMSQQIREWVAERAAGAPNRLEAERRGIEAFFEFVRQHKSIYRIISEAEFVAPREYRDHYEGFAKGYQANMKKAAAKGEIREGDYEIWAWATMGQAVFLGMRYAEWDDSRPPAELAKVMTDLLAHGIGPGDRK